MEEFIHFWRRRLALHAAFIFLVALGIGFVFMTAQDSALPDPTIQRWRLAHTQGLTHGFLLFGMAAAFGYFRLNRRYLQIAGSAVLVGAWSAVLAAVISANFEVDGRQFSPDGWNRVAFILFGLGVGGVFAGFGLIVLRAAWETLRVAIAPMTWRNWAGTIAVRPRIVTEPGNPAAGPPGPQELVAAVDEGLRRRMPIRACGARGSWNRAAITSGMIIDMSRLNRVLDFTPSDPSTGTPGRVRVQAGMRIGDVSRWLSQQDPPHTLATATVIPWVQVGGAVANGCHGTGVSHPEFPDTIVAMEIVQDLDGDGFSALESYVRPAPAAPPSEIDTWNALLVNLGAMGVVYSVTFECVPMFRVHLQESRDDMSDVIQNQLPAIAAHEYAEVFWFPYTDQCWIKTWDTTAAPLEGLPFGYWFSQWFRNRLLGPPFFYTLALAPWLTPLATHLFDLLIPKLDRVLELPDAMHYQRHFSKAVDIGNAIPFDPNDPNLEFERVRAAWFAVVDRLDAARYSGIYPQNLVLHLRFTRSGEALLAPSTGHPFTAYIEILTHRGTPRFEEHFEAIERDWRRLGGRPHWGKLIFHPERVRDAYPATNVAKFVGIQKQMDPNGVFLNDHLRDVLRV